MKIYDLSPTIDESIAVFPGDTPFQRKTVLDIQNQDAIGLSSIESTVHLGSHTDAPNHCHPKGPGIDQRSLDFYLGPAQVIEVLELGPFGRITPEHLKPIHAPRVLFKTKSFPNPYQWKEDFNALSPELIHALNKEGVHLVGIDTPSIDLANDKILKTHLAVYENDMAILEGIVLDDVPEGVFELIALPLKLKDADASPVRAILIDRGDRSYAS